MVGVRLDGTLWQFGQYKLVAYGARFQFDPNMGPSQVGADSDWESAYRCWGFNLAKRRDGTVWMWGRPDRMRNGFRFVENQDDLVEVPGIRDTAVIEVVDSSNLVGRWNDGSYWWVPMHHVDKFGVNAVRALKRLGWDGKLLMILDREFKNHQ